MCLGIKLIKQMWIHAGKSTLSRFLSRIDSQQFIVSLLFIKHIVPHGAHCCLLNSLLISVPD